MLSSLWLFRIFELEMAHRPANYLGFSKILYEISWQIKFFILFILLYVSDDPISGLGFWEKLISFFFVFVSSSENLYPNKYNSTQRPFYVNLCYVKKPKIKSQKLKVKSQKFVNSNFLKIHCSTGLTWSNGFRVIWSNIDQYK